ncbi:citrate synthase [Xylaria digitata]|nr:citrate synthase [Xylaria digitata]
MPPLETTFVSGGAVVNSKAVHFDRPSEYLEIVDSRTQAKYILPTINNSIKAADLGNIKLLSHTPDHPLLNTRGLKVFDRGFTNTACVESSITFIDGERGQIKFRGYDIEYLYDNHDYEEKLLAELKAPQSVVDTIRAFPPQFSTGSMILAGLAAFAALDEGTKRLHSQAERYYIGNTKNTDAAIIRTLAALATTTALVYCHKRGKKFTKPDLEGTFIGNTLKMMGKEDKGIEKCLERLWILYADHEMTNSTAAFLHASSTLTDPLSRTISAIVSAYGPLHGGAIDLAYQEFKAIASVKHCLFGFGHRIYKTVDPRTKFIHEMIDEQVRNPMLSRSPLLEIALKIEKVASTDDYFVSRRLAANTDLYGPLLYTALSFESDIIVAMASLSRVADPMAHWRESMQQKPML